MRTLLLILSIAVLTDGTNAQTSPKGESSRTRLRLQVLSTYPVPVIDSAHADAKDIPGGFECGSTVKVTVNGKTEYHLFASVMEGIRATVWTYNRLEHWISGDGIHWNRNKGPLPSAPRQGDRPLAHNGQPFALLRYPSEQVVYLL